jgi:hypothetical protein
MEKTKKASPKNITRFKGETKIEKLNKEALRVIRANKGKYG